MHESELKRFTNQNFQFFFFFFSLLEVLHNPAVSVRTNHFTRVVGRARKSRLRATSSESLLKMDFPFPSPSLDMLKQRETVLAISTIVALSAGLNYLFSSVPFLSPSTSFRDSASADKLPPNRAYAPQLASRLRLTSTQTNIIGAAGNLGVYLSCEFDHEV